MKTVENPWKRTLSGVLADRLERCAVVLVTGPRHGGKTTLARDLRDAAERDYFALDTLAAREDLRRNPGRVLGSLRPVTIDEVHHLPALLEALCEASRRPPRRSRCLLTSSTRMRLPESWMARGEQVDHLVLRPLTAREKRGDVEPAPWPDLLAASDPGDVLRRKRVARAVDWMSLALEGGFPGAALASGPAERSLWLGAMVDNALQRDLRDLAHVGDLDALLRLLRLVAQRPGSLLNAAALARDAGLSRSTAQRWLGHLADAYLVTPLEPLAAGRGRRAIRTPKLYLGDAGLGLHLAGVADADALRRLPQPGVWLEHLVLNELLAWRETDPRRPEVRFHRTAGGQEVDFVLVAGERLLPIEVRATPSPRLEDARSLEAFTAELRDRAPFGLLLHAGDGAEQIAPRTVALPVGMVL